MGAPFRLSVFDKTGAAQDWVGAPLKVEATIRADAPSDLVVTVDADDPQVEVLAAEGARLRCDYLALDTPRHLVSGLLGEGSGEAGAAGVRTFVVRDAWSVLMGIVARPVPAAALTAQTVEYRTITGPAETVVKTLIAENASWMGLPVTVATDLGRGDTISASLRFHYLRDRLMPALAQAGIVLDARIDGAGWWIDVREPVTVTDVLTQASGVVLGGSWKVTPPLITRAEVGGGGDGTARTWVEVVDTALETAWNVRLPTVVDARDTTDTTELTARGWAAIAEGAPTGTVTASLSETEDFRVFDAIDLGDSVPVQLDGAPVITGRLTEVSLTWDAENGLTVVPKIGDVSVDQDDISAAIRQLAARVRNQETRS